MDHPKCGVDPGAVSALLWLQEVVSLGVWGGTDLKTIV